MSSKTLRRKGNGTFGGQNAGKSFKIKGKQLPSTSVQRLFSAVYRPDTLNSSKSSGGDTVRVRPPLPAPRKTHLKSNRFRVRFLFRNRCKGVEGAAAQSDSPVDCRDRGRPRRAVRAANRPPLPAPGKKHCRSSAFFSLQFRCSEAAV